ncbi:SDR family NAD(P)-dependent oxidoreductase [Myxococcus sp. CA039A]|uniref:SDR family NAD(P)-dependent oxidoreductase n=1 Tax=Myxococcus sp. CA039A TaxID=2741737 RepID=UPI00157AFE8A|nr:SDR family oxidoreductase [Myxococcus sp. CA039A]NTX55307.1 SDR family oxidoreductase [Myxococcus sp. CA039A]
MGSQVAVVTGASSGIGLGLTRALLERGFSVVGTARQTSREPSLVPTEQLALVDGDVGDKATARKVFEVAESRFGQVDLLINNAGLFIAKPFTDYDESDFAQLVSTNIAGFFHMSQQALRWMVPRKAGHIVNIGTSLVGQPISGVSGALAILTKGGLETATRALSIEYAGQGIRVNTVAAGTIDTPMHSQDKHPFLRTMSPMHRVGTVAEMVDAVLYLHGATYVSGEVLHVDGGAHAGKW